MASLENRTIEDNMIIAFVRTNKVGSECDVEVCSVDEWKELTEEEAEKMAIEAINESGMYEIYW